MQYLTYTIKKRGGEIVGQVSCENPRQAFISAIFWVKQKYMQAGKVIPIFDADPEFYAEPEYH